MGDDDGEYYDAMDTTTAAAVNWKFEDGEDVVFNGLDGKVTREVENSDEVRALFFSSNHRTAYQNGCSDTPSKPTHV
jgi:hypothetical protein